jgi:peptide/nickel transport system substrate-binding protein
MVVLTVCGALGVGTATGSAAAASKPKAGGTLNFAGSSAPPALDPAVQNAVPSQATEAAPFLAIFDGLLTPDSVKGVAKPRIGTMATKDSITWTLTLRSGVKFSDGAAFDANAVRTNWDRIIKKTPTSPARANFDEVASYVVTDPLTVTITLKGPNVDFAYALSTYAQNYLVSPQQLTANEAAVAASPIGAGAYTVKDFVRNASLSLVKNPNYYGKTYFDAINIAFIADESQRLATLRSGGADLIKTTDPSTANQGKLAGFNVTNLNTAGGQAIMFNTSKAPFNDVRARRAVAYAVDNKALNAAVFQGSADPVSTIFPKGSPYYEASVKQLSPNDKKAQALFDELAAEGKPVSFTVTSTNTAGYVNAGQWIQTKLAGFKNVTVKVEPLLTGSLTTTVWIPGAYQAGLFPPKAVVASDLAQYFGTGGSRNYAKYTNPTMDAALRKATTAANLNARAAAVKEVQELVVQDVPFFFYVRDASYSVFGKTVKGHNPGDYYLNVPDWTKMWKVSG